MRIPVLAVRLPIIFFWLASFTLTSAADEIRHEEEPIQSDQQDLGKRLYDFGLGKRSYRYGNDFKRRPMYDFGLGKRSQKMYSFGLGKRAELEEDGYGNYLDDGEQIPETEMYDDDEMQNAEKRKMYSFGLGKRAAKAYNFGLGKRERLYRFGLGKREHMYSFGLGKRSPKMYSFGLGKRESDYNMEKREVNPNELKTVLQETHDETNNTAIVDSHEVMGHGDRLRSLEKRSPRQYSFGLGKREDDLDSFPRQYRKPNYYNFGLGKRDY